MSVNLEADGLRTDVVRIVQDIFTTMLGMEVEVNDSLTPAADSPVVSASMHLTGPWNGAVLLQCGLPAACQFTATMLGADEPGDADDTVKDVMGELINMVAGNFKSLLGGGTHLSLPTVVEGSDYRFRILRGEQTARVGFLTPAGPLFVTLVEIREAAR